MAGYEKDMKNMLSSNDGLERRFGYVYRFKAAGAQLIQSIFVNQLKLNSWKIAKNDRKEVCEFFRQKFQTFETCWGLNQTVALPRPTKFSVAANFQTRQKTFFL